MRRQSRKAQTRTPEKPWCDFLQRGRTKPGVGRGTGKDVYKVERSHFLTTLIFTQSPASQQPVKLAFSKQLTIRMSEKFTSFTVAGQGILQWRGCPCCRVGDNLRV